MKNWIDHVIEMGADYILWDEPHWAGDGGWYPLENNEWSCRCQTCQHYFERMFNEPMPSTWSNKISIFQRSEEHTSELQSRGHLVCRLLLEKKNKKYHIE